MEVPVGRRIIRGPNRHFSQEIRRLNRIMSARSSSRSTWIMAMTVNSDVGDSWEWADSPRYPERFAGMGIRIGVNYMVYAIRNDPLIGSQCVVKGKKVFTLWLLCIGGRRFSELHRINRNVRLYLAQFNTRLSVRPRQSPLKGHLDSYGLAIVRVVNSRRIDTDDRVRIPQHPQ